MHATAEQLTAGLDAIRDSPTEVGRLELIVRRPAVDAREVLQQGELDAAVGLVGDTWIERSSQRTPDGSAHPDMQVTLINARASTLFAVDPERRALAGDQLHVDLHLGPANLPPGTRLAIGGAVIEVTDQPHTGCQKFSARFGVDALKMVNSDAGRELRLRGLNARVVQGGTIAVGDEVVKLPPG